MLHSLRPSEGVRTSSINLLKMYYILVGQTLTCTSDNGCKRTKIGKFDKQLRSILAKRICGCSDHCICMHIWSRS